jgi:L-cystine transport system substrate-binding protein
MTASTSNHPNFPHDSSNSRDTGLTRRAFIGGTALTFASLALAGCSSTSSSADSSATTAIKVAYVQGGNPTSYTDENGNPTGYEIDVIDKVAELLPQYSFSFTGLEQTAVFAGLGSGVYDLALTNSFWTPQRAENYLQPSQNIGVSILGFFTRQEHADISTLAEAATAGLSLAPITAGDGNYYVVEDYNEKNPDNQITLTATDDSNAFTEAFSWVAEGRYDFALVPLQYWNALVADEDGSLHGYADDLRFSIIGATKTWSFLAQGRESFETDYSAALKELEDDGTLSSLSIQWYGIDNFEYLTDDTQNYNYL